MTAPSDTSTYRVAHRHAFDALADKPRREAVARHDLLQTHLPEFSGERYA